MRKTLITGIAAVVTALTFTVMPADPASAHPTRVEQGDDFASVTAYHDVLFVTDAECDGQDVYAHFFFRNGTELRRFDRNGCDPGNNRYGFDRQIRKIRVCETGTPVLCSPFKLTHPAG